MKKRIIAFLCLCVMVLSIFPCVPEKALAAEEFYELKNGQVITLKNASSGWFMNLQHGTDANGTKINVYPWDETPPYTQKYKVSLNADGSFKLATLCAPSRFVDVRRYSKPLAESQGIVIWAEDGDTHKHLRLKKVGDKVAIVFANNTNLCIAPSSESAAKTKQTQMIVRKLDTSKTEMFWNVCDEKGVELSSETEKQVVNSTYDQTSSLRVILSPVCVEGMALTISDNDTLVYAPIAATMQELDKQIFTISESRYGQNRYSIGIQCGQEEKVLTACSLSNGGNVLMTYDFNFNPNRAVSFHIERADYCLFNCGINAIKNGDNLVFSFDNGYVLDVKDFGQTADHSVQIWQGDAGNNAQMFTVTIVDDSFIRSVKEKEYTVNLNVAPGGQLTDSTCLNRSINCIYEYFFGDTSRNLSEKNKLSNTSAEAATNLLNEKLNQLGIRYTRVRVRNDYNTLVDQDCFINTILEALKQGHPVLLSTYKAKRDVFNYCKSSNGPTLLGGHYLVVIGCNLDETGAPAFKLVDPYTKSLWNLSGNKKPADEWEKYYINVSANDLYEYVRNVIY